MFTMTCGRKRGVSATVGSNAGHIQIRSRSANAEVTSKSGRGRPTLRAATARDRAWDPCRRYLRMPAASRVITSNRDHFEQPSILLKTRLSQGRPHHERIDTAFQREYRPALNGSSGDSLSKSELRAQGVRSCSADGTHGVIRQLDFPTGGFRLRSAPQCPHSSLPFSCSEPSS